MYSFILQNYIITNSIKYLRRKGGHFFLLSDAFIIIKIKANIFIAILSWFKVFFPYENIKTVKKIIYENIIKLTGG